MSSETWSGNWFVDALYVFDIAAVRKWFENFDYREHRHLPKECAVSVRTSDYGSDSLLILHNTGAKLTLRYSETWHHLDYEDTPLERDMRARISMLRYLAKVARYEMKVYAVETKQMVRERRRQLAETPDVNEFVRQLNRAPVQAPPEHDMKRLEEKYPQLS